MNNKHSTRLLLALALGSAFGIVRAQGAETSAAASPSRIQIRMETKDFLQTHRWDEPAGTWMLKAGVEAPSGVVSRSVVKAQRDEFMRLNRWDETTESWTLRKPVLPSISSLTREEVRAETIAFHRTHHWEEEGGRWVAVRPVKAK